MGGGQGTGLLALAVHERENNNLTSEIGQRHDRPVLIHQPEIRRQAVERSAFILFGCAGGRGCSAPTSHCGYDKRQRQGNRNSDLTLILSLHVVCLAG